MAVTMDAALLEHPLGRLHLDSLPFWQMLQNPTKANVINGCIATGAGSMVLIGAIVATVLITRYQQWGVLWSRWLTSPDHKKIGIMYIVLAFVMLVRALIEAVVMRAQQAFGLGGGFLSPEHFAQLFSTHGTIMIFFMAMPFLIGVINYVMPLQIGARDVSFPILNSVSLALTAAGAALVMTSLVVGKFSTGGWFGYPPYTEATFSPGVGPDYWIWALTLSSLGSMFTGINFATTIYKERAPGMSLMRMPLFTWTALCTSILMIFAMPPLTVATAQLALDRYLGFHYFTNGLGGNMMHFANLFWLFGHPEVYILILPAFGVYSEVISTFSGKVLYGYVSLVAATMAIALLSFTVWLHHFFTMGQSAHINAIFGIASMLIGIPTGVKIYDWMLTMFRGRVRFTVPMVYSMGFILLFVLGGMSGILLAIPPSIIKCTIPCSWSHTSTTWRFPVCCSACSRPTISGSPRRLASASTSGGASGRRCAGSSGSCWHSFRSIHSASWGCRGEWWRTANRRTSHWKWWPSLVLSCCSARWSRWSYSSGYRLFIAMRTACSSAIPGTGAVWSGR